MLAVSSACNDGRFGGPVDEASGEFRTIYAASTMLGCLLEVLAPLRPDPALAVELDAIVEDEQDADDFPTAAAGVPAGTSALRDKQRMVSRIPALCQIGAERSVVETLARSYGQARDPGTVAVARVAQLPPSEDLPPCAKPPGGHHAARRHGGPLRRQLSRESVTRCCPTSAPPGAGPH